MTILWMKAWAVLIYLVGRIQGQYFSPEDDQQAAYQQVGSNSIESGDIPIYRDQTGDQNFVANPQQPTETFGLGDTGNNLFVNNPPVSGNNNNNNNNNPFLGSGGPATFIVEPSIVQPDPTFVSFSTPPVQNVGGVRPSFTTTDIFQPGPPVQGSIAPSFPVFTPQPNVPTIFPTTTQQQQPSAFPNFVPSPPISQQLPPAPAPAPAPAPVQIPPFAPAPAPPAPINNPPFQPPAPVNQVIVNPGVPVPAPPPNTPPVVPPVGGDPGAAANNNNLQCHVRTCDQTITGRNLPYRRALEIVQNEEYLDEADLDLIRRRRRRYRRAEPLGRRVHRQKRQTAGQIIVNIIENDPNAPILAIGAVALGGVGLAALGAGAPAAPPPPPNPPPAQQQQPLRQQITEQNILPGETGGGALPFGTGPVAFEALALVPAGLTAVSVFPPFVNQARQFNAVAVIFREDGTNRNYYEDSSSSAWGPLYQHLYRYKRGISLQKYFRTTKSTFQGLGQAVSDRFDRLQDRFFKKEEPEHLEYQEYYPQYDYEPQYQQQHYGQQGYYDYGQQQQFDDPNAIYEDDLFGFRVRVRLLDREPCTLGVTCFEDEFEGELATRVDPFRDPEFNIVNGDPDSSTTTTGNTLSDAIQQAFFRRQTNEEFSSDAPPDCRTELNPSGCVAPNRRTSSFFSPGSLSFFKRLF